MSETTASAKAQDSERSATKNKRGAKKDVSDPSLNMDEIRELADLVDDYGFTDFEFENENIRVRLSKMTGAPAMQQAAPFQSAPAAAPVSAAPKAEAEAPVADP